MLFVNFEHLSCKFNLALTENHLVLQPTKPFPYGSLNVPLIRNRLVLGHSPLPLHLPLLPRAALQLFRVVVQNRRRLLPTVTHAAVWNAPVAHVPGAHKITAVSLHLIYMSGGGGHGGGRWSEFNFWVVRGVWLFVFFNCVLRVLFIRSWEEKSKNGDKRQPVKVVLLSIVMVMEGDIVSFSKIWKER